MVARQLRLFAVDGGSVHGSSAMMIPEQFVGLVNLGLPLDRLVEMEAIRKFIPRAWWNRSTKADGRVVKKHGVEDWSRPWPSPAGSSFVD